MQELNNKIKMKNNDNGQIIAIKMAKTKKKQKCKTLIHSVGLEVMQYFASIESINQMIVLTPLLVIVNA